MAPSTWNTLKFLGYDDDGRNSWTYHEPVTDRHMDFTIGWITDDKIPCMALWYKVDDQDQLCLIPIDYVLEAMDVVDAGKKASPPKKLGVRVGKPTGEPTRRCDEWHIWF